VAFLDCIDVTLVSQTGNPDIFDFARASLGILTFRKKLEGKPTNSRLHQRSDESRGLIQIRFVPGFRRNGNGRETAGKARAALYCPGDEHILTQIRALIDT
jgi:hypothetical protein